MQNPQVIRTIGERRKSSITAQSSPKGDAGITASFHNLHFQNEHPFLSFIDADGERQTLSLKDKPVVTMGTQKTCDVRMGSSQGRIHAQIRLDENDQVWLDSRSDSTPCKINGARVAEPVQLKQGDSIDVGGRIVIYGEHANATRRKNSTTPNTTPAKPPAPAPAPAADEGEGWQVRGEAALSPMTGAAVELRSESSPVGSDMLARKLRAQVNAKRALAMPPAALPISALPADDDAPLAAYKAHGMPLGEGLLRSASAGLEGGPEVRRAYNRATYSPSMGCTEEEQARLRSEYYASLPAASPESPLEEPWIVRTPGDSDGVAGGGSGGVGAPGAGGVYAGGHGGVELFKKEVAGFEMGSRQAYNKTVYSPSMGIPEEEVRALRMAESRASSAHTAHLCSSSGASEAEDEDEDEIRGAIVPFHALDKSALNSHITSDLVIS